MDLAGVDDPAKEKVGLEDGPLVVGVEGVEDVGGMEVGKNEEAMNAENDNGVEGEWNILTRRSSMAVGYWWWRRKRRCCWLRSRGNRQTTIKIP